METELENAAPALPAEQATPEPVDDTNTEQIRVGVIPPPSQTNAVWRNMGLHATDNGRIYFCSATDKGSITDTPEVLRFRAERRSQLNTGTTRADIQTNTEDRRVQIDELKKMYNGHRNTVRERIEHVSSPSEELTAEWREKLKEYDLGLLNVDWQPENEAKDDEEIELRPRSSQLESDDEFDAHEGLQITYEGTRETTKHTDLNDLRRWWVLKYNPENKNWTAELEAKARQHPDFLADTARFLTEFGGRTIQEAIDELKLDAKPNTVSQWMRRSKSIRNPYDKVRARKYQGFTGSMVCVRTSNNRVRVEKLLDNPMLPVSPEVIAKALETHRKDSVRIAVKNGTRLRYTDARMVDAIEEVNNSYRESYVMYWLGVGDPPDTDVMDFVITEEGNNEPARTDTNVMDFPMYEAANDEQPQN